MKQARLEREADTFAKAISDADPAIARTVPASLSWELGAIAIGLHEGELTIAFSEQPPYSAVERLERATGMRIRIAVLPHDLIQKALARTLGRADRLAASPASVQAPAVQAVDALHERAFFERCSDVHIEPQADHTRVRFRIDGLLREVERFSDPLSVSIVSRIKVLAGMDIAERRQPQDGRYTLSIAGHTLDARVSCVPSLEGENVVIRLLDHHVRLPSLDELGMPRGMRDSFSDVIQSSCGFVVVCGPTGSGKTTTLYAALAELNGSERAICTVEDPVEQAIAGITQVQVNGRAGVTFASVLRAHLRQDPNVIMVGEVRDGETANTAVAAALSGQLVFATLHSNDAPRTIERLVELGVTRSAIAAGLSAIVAQRLVRRLCVHCTRPASFDAALLRKYGLDPAQTYHDAGGCERCGGTGFHERVGLFELLILDDRLRDEIAAGASSVRLAAIASEGGYRTLRDDCLSKLAAGITTVSEYVRIVHAAAPR